MNGRDYESEAKNRIGFIRDIVKSSGAGGVVFANSGGKDCALAGILCKKACADTVGLILPCGTKANFGSDKDDAEEISALFDIEARYIDITGVKNEFIKAIGGNAHLNKTALGNIAPRLRMNALYAVSAGENRLVAGTGNRSEIYMGYFTKWGDGAYDFNPIADLTVSEVYGFLRYFGVPEHIINKPPSAGLFDGQTDESEMGVAYSSVDAFLINGETDERDMEIIEKYHRTSGHKRRMPAVYGLPGDTPWRRDG